MTLTLEQYNKLATKQDLTDLRTEMLDKMVTKTEFNSVLKTLDFIVRKLDSIEHSFVSNLGAHDRFEQRFTRIENHFDLNPYSSK